MVKTYLSRSYYNTFSNHQLQPRMPGGTQRRCCVQPCQCVLSQPFAFCHSRLQTRIAGASERKKVAEIPCFVMFFGRPRPEANMTPKRPIVGVRSHSIAHLQPKMLQHGLNMAQVDTQKFQLGCD